MLYIFLNQEKSMVTQMMKLKIINPILKNLDYMRLNDFKIHEMRG